MLWPNGSKIRPYVSSSFGPRRAPVAGASTYHRGTDFSHTFQRIRAIAAGRVVNVGAVPGWSAGGTQVWIQHDGFFSKSLHMVNGSPVVRAGDWVSEGQDLGQMGRTGTATDTHLHLELTPGAVHYANTGQVDPVAFITNRLAESAGGVTPTVPAPTTGADMFIFYAGTLSASNAYLATYDGRVLKVRPTVGVEAVALIAAQPQIPRVQLTAAQVIDLCAQGGYVFKDGVGHYDGVPSYRPGS